MKKTSLSILATIALGFVALFTACSSSDSEEVPDNDSNAGEFKIINTTRGVELTDGSSEIYKDDVLKIQFNGKYGKKYTTTYKVKIGDGTETEITDKDGKYTISDCDTTYTFVLTAKYNGEGKNLSASKTITITQKYKVTIPYVLYMTEDLADLINITVKYTKDGENRLSTRPYGSEKIRKALVSEMVTVVKYEKDGVVKLYPEMPEGVKADELKYYNASEVPEVTKLILEIPYYKPDIDTEFSVSVSPNDERRMDRDKKYVFKCQLGRKEAINGFPVKNGEAKGVDEAYKETYAKVDPVLEADTLNYDDALKYLDRTLPEIEKQVIKLHIDSKGKVTKR